MNFAVGLPTQIMPVSAESDFLAAITLPEMELVFARFAAELFQAEKSFGTPEPESKASDGLNEDESLAVTSCFAAEAQPEIPVATLEPSPALVLPQVPLVLPVWVDLAQPAVAESVSQKKGSETEPTSPSVIRVEASPSSQPALTASAQEKDEGFVLSQAPKDWLETPVERPKLLMDSGNRLSRQEEAFASQTWQGGQPVDEIPAPVLSARRMPVATPVQRSAVPQLDESPVEVPLELSDEAQHRPQAVAGSDAAPLAIALRKSALPAPPQPRAEIKEAKLVPASGPSLPPKSLLPIETPEESVTPSQPQASAMRQVPEGQNSERRIAKAEIHPAGSDRASNVEPLAADREPAKQIEMLTPAAPRLQPSGQEVSPSSLDNSTPVRKQGGEAVEPSQTLDAWQRTLGPRQPQVLAIRIPLEGRSMTGTSNLLSLHFSQQAGRLDLTIQSPNNAVRQQIEESLSSLMRNLNSEGWTAKQGGESLTETATVRSLPVEQLRPVDAARLAVPNMPGIEPRSSASEPNSSGPGQFEDHRPGDSSASRDSQQNRRGRKRRTEAWTAAMQFPQDS